MSLYKMRTEFAQKFGKPVLIFLAFIFVVGGIWQFGAAPMMNKLNPKGEDRVLAVVNGKPITLGEFDAVWGPAAKQQMQQSTTLSFAEMRGRIFNQLVEMRLLQSYAERKKIEVSQSAMQTELDKRVTEYLKANRRAILGKDLTAEEERTDPRDDSKYAAALAQMNASLSDLEETAKQANPESQIVAELTIKAIQDSVQKEIGTVSDKDIDDSYIQYSIEKLVVGGLPKDQQKSAVDKLLKAAKLPGADFTKLAKDNAAVIDKNAKAIYSLDMQMQMMQMQMMQMMYPQQVIKAITTMKPGEIRGPIDTPAGVYIVKLVNTTKNAPAKLDKKARDARRDMILGTRRMAVSSDLNAEMHANADIRPQDKEMNGYYRYQLALQSGSQKELTLACNAFEDQVKNNPSDIYSAVMYAKVLMIQQRYADAVKQLYGLLEGRSSASGSDLRMMYAQALVKTGKKDKAIEQYQEVSKASLGDPNVHLSIGQAFHDLGREDLAAQEKVKADKISADLQKLQGSAAKSMPGAPQPVPNAPKKGG